MKKKNDLERPLFTSFQICDALDIRKERFREWIDFEYIKPKVRAKGRGSKNLFSKTDVYFIVLFKDLLESGFSREESSKRVESYITIYKAIVKKRVKKGKPFNPSVIVIPLSAEEVSESNVDGTMQWPSKVIYEKDDTIRFDDPSFLSNFDHILVFNFAKIMKKVDDALDKLM